jgi:uncharacterized DUF497 family protein
VLIIWDEPKRLANLDKHGLDFALVDLDFFAGALVVASAAGRFKAVGLIGGVLTAVVIFAPLGQEAVSIISLRRANRKERADFYGETK